jgi:hypothetical protein
MSIKKVSNAVRKAAQLLGRHSLPFWSPRYAAHMCMDMSMPALLGYFMTMLYNPNNVSIEASPLTTVAEMEAGLQLCDLVGYNTDRNNKDLPVGSYHVRWDCGQSRVHLVSLYSSLSSPTRTTITCSLGPTLTCPWLPFALHLRLKVFVLIHQLTGSVRSCSSIVFMRCGHCLG